MFYNQIEKKRKKQIEGYNYLLDLANKIINEISSHTGNYDFLAYPS